MTRLLTHKCFNDDVASDERSNEAHCQRADSGTCSVAFVDSNQLEHSTHWHPRKTVDDDLRKRQTRRLALP